MENITFLTVGELAKEMGITVRTLQYYDKENLLKPSSKSEGGRRMYTKKDMVKLHQILSLKYLGFSLDEIRDKLLALDTPEEVAKILEGQELAIQQQIENLKLALTTTKALREEVVAIKTVDFSKYADIIALLKQRNENYWVVKLFDEKLSSHVRNQFKDSPDEGLKLFNKYVEILDKAVQYKEEGEAPNSEKSIVLAKEWWDMINAFTGGDMSILPELMKFNENRDGWNAEIAAKQALIDSYIGEAIEAFFRMQNIQIPGME